MTWILSQLFTLLFETNLHIFCQVKESLLLLPLSPVCFSSHKECLDYMLALKLLE